METTTSGSEQAGPSGARWKIQHLKREEPAVHNVAKLERVGSVLLGAALVAVGARRKGPSGVAAALAGGALLHRGATGHCYVYDALGVSTGSADAVLDKTPRRDDVTSRAATVNARKAVKIEHEVTIDAARSELYEFWRNFENLPQFMDHLISVDVQSPTRSHWISKAPAGQRVEWNAEIVNDVPDSIIAWKTIGHPDISHAGAVNFSDAPGGRTVVRVTLDYEPPGGKLGGAVAKLFAEEPDKQIAADLAKLKRLVEEGMTV